MQGFYRSARNLSKTNSKFYKMAIVYYLGQEFENFFFMQMNWQEFVASDEKGSDET